MSYADDHIPRPPTMYQSNGSLNIPWATPSPPEAEKLFKYPIIGPFQVIKCPNLRETFQ